MNAVVVLFPGYLRALFSGCLRSCLSAGLLLAVTAVVAGEPCQFFEGGRVEEQLLEEMRIAASEGRLFRVVPENSRVGFCVRYFPGREVRGEFTDVVGGLVMPSAASRYGQALLLIHTATMETSDEELDSLVRGHKFIDVEHYPEILFVGRAFEWQGALQGYIYGDLTLRGVTQPVVFNIGIEILEEGLGDLPDRILLRGKGQVNRYHFNMYSHRYFVSETVRLCLDVEMVPWDDMSLAED